MLSTNKDLCVPHVIDGSRELTSKDMNGGKVYHHQKTGLMYWHISKVRLISIAGIGRMNIGELSGKIQELHGKIVLANHWHMQYLLEHQYLIPEEWRGKKILFAGSMYDYDGEPAIDVISWGNTGALGFRWRRNEVRWRISPFIKEEESDHILVIDQN